LKSLSVGISISIVIFSFAYFEIFLLPFFPSLWQLSRFVSAVISSHFYEIAIVLIVIIVLKSWSPFKNFDHLYQKIIALLSFAFLVGFTIANPKGIASFDFEKVIGIFYFLGFLCFSIAIALVSALVEIEKITYSINIVVGLFVLILYWSCCDALISRSMDFPRYGDYKILVWSEQDTDYVYSCQQPKGTLYEVKFDREKKDVSWFERRVEYNASHERICERIFGK